MQSHPRYKFIDYELNYGRHLIHNFVQKSFQNTSPLIVLDLGAGQGDDLLIVKSLHPESKLFAMENFPPYIKNLENKGIEVFSCNLEIDKLPLDDESVDLIIMNQIMEHVKEVFWILNEVSRVLKPGGHFIVGVPNLAGFQNRVLLFFGRQPSTIKNNSAHVRGYTKDDFISLLNSGFTNGYELVDFKGSNFYPLPPIFAKPMAKLLPSMSWAIFMNFRKLKTYNNEFLTYPASKNLETNFYIGE